MKIDVAVCTYQSERYLEECLTSVEKAVPINKLIVVDHYSTDNTINIAKRHNATILLENVGVGYARQIAIDHVSTPVFLFVDSDVVFHSYDWFSTALSLIDGERKIGAVGIYVPPRLPPLRKKYVDFWWKTVPAIKKYGFVNAYLILKKAVEGIKIPASLGSYEHIYIKFYIQNHGWTTTTIRVNGIHYYDYPDKKGAWLGAGNRLFSGVSHLPRLLARRVLTAPLKAIPPAIATRDPQIVLWNTRYWLGYLKGWLHPLEHAMMKRMPKNEEE